MENSKPYATVSREAVMARCAQPCSAGYASLWPAHPDGSRCYVIIAGDRGLAGGYNANVFKAVAARCGGDSRLRAAHWPQGN